VVDPLSFKKARENNQMIFDYLNKKYGTDWLNNPTKPFGIKNKTFTTAKG
jgi:predicted RNA-binding protein (virulence factor B family)